MTENSLGQVSEHGILLLISFYEMAFIIFGFWIESPGNVFLGLVKIITTQDALLTDYIAIGGMGAAFVNAGLLTLCVIFVYYRSQAKISGATIACLFLILGFGLCGKNVLNIWCIVIGVFLYAKFKKEAFATHINIAFFGAALAPIFSEILFSTTIPIEIRLPLSTLTRLLIGFILVPVSGQLFKAHMGFNLYNMGFTAGIVGILIVALYKSYGFVPDPVMAWTTGNNTLLGWFLYVILASMILAGFYLDRSSISRLKQLLHQTGQAPDDFIAQFGLGVTLLNMGLSGTVSLLYILSIGGDLNGPVFGAIFTIVGFAAFGKHPKNIVPIILGVFLGSLAKPWSASDPSMQLIALFGTTLAPIAGRFGWHWGVLAGFIHSSAALSVGALHAGFNLYNNGFAAGLVASVLVPVIMAIRTRSEEMGVK